MAALTGEGLQSPGVSETQLLRVRERTGLARAKPPPERRANLRVGAVQQRWHPDPAEHEGALEDGRRWRPGEGAQIVCLQELTLAGTSPWTRAGRRRAGSSRRSYPEGPTYQFAARPREPGPYVHASLYERAEDDEGLGYNTAIVVAPGGELVARTRKLHIRDRRVHEDRYFGPGPARPARFPRSSRGRRELGLPTCWDEWFPELARAYSLEGADVLVYPTAIGSEPDHPDFDTEPLWERVILGNAIANGVFMVAVNRFGEEPP